MQKFPLLACAALSIGVLAMPYAASAYVFSQNLSLGASGFDVITLQQVLNASVDTRVAETGAGSPGQETTYFGQKTYDAVKRFQAKYRTEVLAPSGLTSPTGFVGPATRAQLQKVSASATGGSSASVPSYTPAQTPPPASTITASNIATVGPVKLPPMAERVEMYIAEVKKGLRDNGESEDIIAQVEQKIREIAPQAQATLDKFYKQEQEFYAKEQAQAIGPVMAFFKDSLVAVRTFFVGETARAALGLPFGGYVATVMPVCTCVPAVSQIFVFLANPNLAVTNMNLDYIFGTQAFNWHTLPLPGVATLGLYEPVTPTCFIGIPPKCIPLPSRGLITPITGSSLLPPVL